MIQNDQLPERYRQIIDEQFDVYGKGRSVTSVDAIPDTKDIPIEDQTQWLRIPGVICVFVDMKNSTKLSAEAHDKSTAGAYQLFSGTAVKLFNEFEAPYIEVRGDGVFALFDKNQPYRALASAVSFKTFASEVFVPTVKEETEVEIGCHIGIDLSVVLVRRIGLKRYGGRTDRQNEVWAGRTVNMASKLSSLAKDGEMLVSDRFFKLIPNELARISCGCPNNTILDLWTEVPLVGNDKFDFSSSYLLKSCWCKTHGNDYCEKILALDNAK